MLAKPFAVLIALILAWTLVPPTLCLVAAVAWRRVAPRAGRPCLPLRPSRVRQWYFAYAFLAVAFAWSTLFLFLPLARAVSYGFTDKSLAPTAAVRWLGLQNYVDIASDPLWWKSVGVTAVYIAGALPFSILLCLFLASLIVRLPPAWQTFFKAALYLPGVTSLVVGATVLKWIFYPGDGFANVFLRQLGLIGANLTWFGDPRLALPTLIGMAWLGANGLGVIIYCAALGGIPTDYYEAADIDGASAFRKFLAITWPLARPATVYVTITGLIGGFQIFAPALLITGGGPRHTTNFVNYRIYQTFYYDNRFGMACAMSVVLMAVIVTVSFINYRFLATDVEY